MWASWSLQKFHRNFTFFHSLCIYNLLYYPNQQLRRVSTIKPNIRRTHTVFLNEQRFLLVTQSKNKWMGTGPRPSISVSLRRTPSASRQMQSCSYDWPCERCPHKLESYRLHGCVGRPIDARVGIWRRVLRFECQWRWKWEWEVVVSLFFDSKFKHEKNMLRIHCKLSYSLDYFLYLTGFFSS